MSDTPSNPALAGFTPAQLLAELQSRHGVIVAMVTTNRAEDLIRASVEGESLNDAQVVKAAAMLMQDACGTVQEALSASAVAKLDRYWEDNAEDIIEDVVREAPVEPSAQPLRPAFPRPLAP